MNKGPFPPPDTEVRIQCLSRDPATGEASLKITPYHGNTVYYEIGDNDPTTASAKVESFTNFKTKELQLKFLCIDSEGEHDTGSSEEWKNTISLKYRVFQQGDDWLVELKAYPRGDIRYTTDGSDPKGFGASYDSPFLIPAECPFVLAIAQLDGVTSVQEKINVKEHITKEVKVDPAQPVTWRRHHSKLTARTAFEFMERLEKFQGTAYGVIIDVMANDNSQDINYSGEDSFGLQGKEFEKLVNQFQGIMDGSQVELNIERLHFDKGQQLLDWIAEAKSKLHPGEVKQ